MAEKDIPAARHRGTLQPAKPAWDGLQCALCGGWFIPNEESFGCPGCHEQREIYDHLVSGIVHTHDPA